MKKELCCVASLKDASPDANQAESIQKDNDTQRITKDKEVSCNKNIAVVPQVIGIQNLELRSTNL